MHGDYKQLKKRCCVWHLGAFKGIYRKKLNVKSTTMFSSLYYHLKVRILCICQLRLRVLYLQRKRVLLHRVVVQICMAEHIGKVETKGIFFLLLLFSFFFTALFNSKAVQREDAGRMTCSKGPQGRYEPYGEDKSFVRALHALQTEQPSRPRRVFSKLRTTRCH